MKLYERFGDHGFHTTIFTTFGVDFDAYESIVLSRLRGSGSHNNILVADQGMLTHALSGSSAAPQCAGRLYSVSGATAQGVFHTKIILQIGRQKGRLIIGSANATASGLAGNLELTGIIECDQEPSSSQNIIATSWEYVSRLLDRNQWTLSRQLSWMKTRTPWLLRAEPINGRVDLPDNTQAAFLATDGNDGIMERFTALLTGEVVERLTVISPYWDNDLAALKELCGRLHPKETLLLIDRDRALFPNIDRSDLKNTRILDIGSFGKGRFVHAKLFVASTEDAEHILFGSANCTIAALGREDFGGRNEEACLYRRVPRGDISNKLELEKIISEALTIDPADLPKFSADKPLQFDDLSKRNPGSFECLFDTLIWYPPPTVKLPGVDVELLKVNGVALPCTMKQLPNSTEAKIRFQLVGAQERPAFARLKFADGSLSVPAIISLFEALRGEIREIRGKGVERVIAQLENETEEGLWLLEALDELEAAKATESELVSGRQRQKASIEDDEHFKILDYQSFTAGCRLRSEGSAVGRNSLSGTEFSSVRAFLNRVLSIQADDEPQETGEEEESFKKILNLGDEVIDAEGAIESGHIFYEPSQEELDKDKEKSRIREVAAKRIQNQDHIIKATYSFIDRIRTRAKNQKLTSFDILRLRAMLTILAAAGWGGTERELQKGLHFAWRTPLQVLPISGTDHSWPRLCGKILFSLFGGNKPNIQYLQIEDIYDQIPDDLIECWACCFWVIQACLLAMKSEPILGFDGLTDRVYTLTGLRPEEMLDDRATQIIDNMGERFSKRLGLNSEVIKNAHRDYVSRNTKFKPAVL